MSERFQTYNIIEFNNCTFEGNQAGFSGVGHLVSQNGKIIFNNCNFIHNLALCLWTVRFGLGSVFSIGGSIQIFIQSNNCLYIDNYAYTVGIKFLNFK